MLRVNTSPPPYMRGLLLPKLFKNWEHCWWVIMQVCNVRYSIVATKKQQHMCMLFEMSNSLTLQTTKQYYHGAQGSECFLVLSNNMAGSGGDYASIHASGHTELMQNWCRAEGLFRTPSLQCSSSSNYDFILFAQSQISWFQVQVSDFRGDAELEE